MNIQQKKDNLVSITHRMRSDSERIRVRIDNLRNPFSRESLQEVENRLWEISDVNAEVCAIVSFLSTIQMMIFSNEYPIEIFELVKINKNDFLLQVSNLLSYYKTISFSILEIERTTRAVYDYHSQIDIMRKNISMGEC